MSYDDLAAVCRIEPTIYSHPWTPGNFRDSLDAGHSAWVMEVAGEIAGYALVMMVLDEAHLLNISVAGSLQGQGLGRALLVHMIEVSRHHKAANMFLEVRVSNTKAIALYESMGFCEIRSLTTTPNAITMNSASAAVTTVRPSTPLSGI